MFPVITAVRSTPGHAEAHEIELTGHRAETAIMAITAPATNSVGAFPLNQI